VFCPWFASGGPEALHQLCDQLAIEGADATLVYFNGDFEHQYNGQIKPEYVKYKNIKSVVPHSFDEIDTTNAVFIFPEITSMQLLDSIKYAKIVFWWLAWNKMDTLQHPVHERMIQACDTRVAYELLEKWGKIDTDKLLMLNAPINSDYLKNEEAVNREKNNIILFNPLKGAQHTQQVFDQLNNNSIPQGTIALPLANMTRTQVQNLVGISKIYIDLGEFPGHDRFPRESAVNGCVTLIGARNSGASLYDFDIQNKFAYDAETDTFDYAHIAQTLADVLNNHEMYFAEQKNFRETIRNEQSVFNQQVRQLIELMGGA
jgi:hypothetical protein